MKTSKILAFSILFISIIGCKKNISRDNSNNLKDTSKIKKSEILLPINEAKEETDNSFVISCGSGCAMTYTPNDIFSKVSTIKVKFKVDMYLNEKLSDTYYEVYIFKYDNLNNIVKIQLEGKNENILENLLPDAQESFKKFSIDLIKDKNLEIKSSATCFEESKIKLPYISVNTKTLKYSILDCTSVNGIEKYNCNSDKLRYISLPNKENVSIILVPQDCGDFDYRYYLIKIKNNKVVGNLYVEGEWYEPENEKNKEMTSFSIDKDYNLAVKTQTLNSSIVENYVINDNGNIVKQ